MITGSAECHLCSWRSVSLPENTAKKLAVVHVRMEHPKVYLEVTGRNELPTVSDWEKWELTVWTDREEMELK